MRNSRTNWKPILTAPRNGVAILVFEPKSQWNDGGISLVEWRPIYEISGVGRSHPIYAWCKPDSDQDEQGGSATVDNPTHWMELPEPPE